MSRPTKPITAKQASYLKSLGYTGSYSITSAEARGNIMFLLQSKQKIYGTGSGQYAHCSTEKKNSDWKLKDSKARMASNPDH